MVDFSWKKQLNFFIKPFLFTYCVCAKGNMFPRKIVLCWSTVLNIPGVILVCIQAVYSLDYFVSEAHRLKWWLDFKQGSETR